MTNWNNPQFQECKPFEGKNINMMPVLIQEGYLPISVAGSMVKRLAVGNALQNATKGKDNALIAAWQECVNTWHDNYTDTGDGVVRYPDGSAVIVLDSENLRAINPRSELSEHYLVLGDEDAEVLKGKGLKLSNDQVQKLHGKLWSRKDVKNVEEWQYLARGKDLLAEYSKLVSDECKRRFKYDENMGLYFPSPQKKPILGLWCLYGFNSGSNALGNGSLDYYNGRLVGVSGAPEALVSQKNLGVEVQKKPEEKLIAAPTLEQLANLGKRFVPDVAREQFIEELAGLYKQ